MTIPEHPLKDFSATDNPEWEAVRNRWSDPEAAYQRLAQECQPPTAETPFRFIVVVVLGLALAVGMAFQGAAS